VGSSVSSSDISVVRVIVPTSGSDGTSILDNDNLTKSTFDSMVGRFKFTVIPIDSIAVGHIGSAVGKLTRRDCTAVVDRKMSSTANAHRILS